MEKAIILLCQRTARIAQTQAVLLNSMGRVLGSIKELDSTIQQQSSSTAVLAAALPTNPVDNICGPSSQDPPGSNASPMDSLSTSYDL
ncbi:unnamed protein product [Schistocephalus solidus]|uniref:BLOC-1-related complex subunit 7 n=1 Tax=Schistocephalus solidus TaxID=70667 RepID=A0A183S9M8_SCHSO|nr:unnamed protein product [Schistocephalus solidus]